MNLEMKKKIQNLLKMRN